MSRKIAIWYVDNKSLDSIASREFMWSEIMKEMDATNKIVENKICSHDTRSVTYSDGTVVELLPVGKNKKGQKYTETYIDENVLKLANSDKFINKFILPATEFVKEKVFLFGVDKSYGLYMKTIF